MKRRILTRRHFRRTRRGIRPVSAHYKKINYGSSWRLFEIKSRKISDPNEMMISEIYAPSIVSAQQWQNEAMNPEEKLWRITETKEKKPTIDTKLREED